MRRRHLLAALGGAVTAGWTARADKWRSTAVPAPPPDSSDDVTTTVTPTGETDDTGSGEDWLPDRQVVDQRTVDRTLALTPAAYTTVDGRRIELGFYAPATDDHPAIVRARMTNRNDFERTFRLHEPPSGTWTYAFPRTTTNRIGLHFVPTANHPLRRNGPSYERTSDGRWLLHREGNEESWYPETVTLGPDETIRSEYYLVGHPDSEHPPIGRYELLDEFELGLTAWRTSEPGPTDDSRLADPDLPSLPVEGDVVWFHDAGPETPIYLEPATERTRLPAALRFVLHNHSRRELQCESYALYRLYSYGWQELTSGYLHNGCWRRPPGDRTEFWLRAFPGKTIDGPGSRETLADLEVDPGTFAFTVTYGWTYAALFELRPPERSG